MSDPIEKCAICVRKPTEFMGKFLRSRPVDSGVDEGLAASRKETLLADFPDIVSKAICLLLDEVTEESGGCLVPLGSLHYTFSEVVQGSNEGVQDASVASSRSMQSRTGLDLELSHNNPSDTQKKEQPVTVQQFKIMLQGNAVSHGGHWSRADHGAGAQDQSTNHGTERQVSRPSSPSSTLHLGSNIQCSFRLIGKALSVNHDTGAYGDRWEDFEKSLTVATKHDLMRGEGDTEYSDADGSGDEPNDVVSELR